MTQQTRPMENAFDGKIPFRMITCFQVKSRKSIAKEATQMEIGTQIRKYRSAQELSQEELAERIYVTR